MRFPIVAAACMLFCSCTEAFAGSPQVAAPPVRPDLSQPAARSAAGENDGSLVLRRDDGSLVDVTELLRPEAISEILARSSEQVEIPLFDLSRLEAEATVDDRVVRITADLTITVRPEAEWVAVPIGLSEVHITGFKYQPPSPAAQAVPDLKDPARKHWHLIGAGVHHLHLDLITQTRPTSSGGHQLSLTLPDATQSRLKVNFASAVDLQAMSTEAVATRTTNELGVVGVEIWGPESAFTLTWSEVVRTVAAQPAIQVQNRMQLDLTTVPILLSGSQLLQISAAPVDELTLEMPQGFQLLELDVRNSTGVSILSQFETSSRGDRQIQQIELTSAAEGQISVDWDLELPQTAFPREIAVQLPRVHGASIQNGDLDILIPPGLLVRQKDIVGAQRKRVATETADQIAATAFRLRSAESLITLDVDEIDALYAVSPELIIQPDGQNALMSVRLQVNVLRGSLLELDFRWPEFESSIWQLLPRSARLLAADQQFPLSLEQLPDDGEQFSIQFPERQSGQFTVELNAFAPLEQLQREDATLLCPEVASESAQPAVITTLDSDTFTLVPRNAATDSALNPLPERSAAPLNEAEGRARTSWLLEETSEPVRFLVNSQAPSVTADVQVALSVQEFGIVVEEDINYRIEHRDMTQLSLAIPEGIRAVVHFEGEGEPLRGVVENSETRAFRLPEPQRGEVTLTVRYLWPFDTEADSAVERQLRLPLVVPDQADVSAVTVATDLSGAIRVSETTAWRPVFSEEYGTAWAVERSVKSVRLAWTPGVPIREYESPVAALCHSVIVGDSILSDTTAAFAGRPPRVSFILPGSLQLQDVIVDGQSLRTGLRAERLSDTTDVRWTLIPPAADTAEETGTDSGQSVFVLSLRTRQQVPLRASLLDPTAVYRPRFGGTAVQVPIIHWVDSPESVELVAASHIFRQLSATTTLPFFQTRGQSALQKVEALSSTMQPELRAVVMQQAEQAVTGSAVCFYAADDARALQLYLIPGVPLLLVSAIACLGSFLLLSFVSSLRISIFVFVTAILLLLCWALAPEWTSVVAPYAVVGTLFGLVAVMFQRTSGDRQSRLLRSPHPQDLPTVFGLSEWFRPGTTSESRESPSASRPSQDVTAPTA